MAQQRLEENKLDIVKKINGGQSIKSVAQEYSANCGTLWYALKEWGVKTKHKCSRQEGRSIADYKDKIINKFNEGISLYQIAKEINFSFGSLTKYASRIGLDTSKNSKVRKEPLKNHKQEIIKSYQDGLSTCKIAKKYKCASTSVLHILQQNNIETREDRKYTADFDFFHVIDTPEKAYVLGWWYTDGNVDLKGKMRLQIADRQILENIKIIIKYDGEIDIVPPPKKFPHRKVQFCLTINKQEMAKDLIDKGCTPNKSLTITFPTVDKVPAHLYPYFLRGVFEGDGSISWNKKNSWACSITGTEEFVTKIAEITGIKEPYYYTRHPDRKNSTRSLMFWKKDDVARFMKFIYDPCPPPHLLLQRKYNSYQEFLRHFDNLE